jgi:hypothetical protein
MVRSRLAAFAIAALTISVLVLGPAARTAATATVPIGFEVPSVVDPIQVNGEPDIAVDKFGRVFSSGPTGTGTQRSVWYGSVDGGHTFRVITPGVPPSAISTIVDPPGGGDTDLNFDRSGKQYFADLYALACLRTAATADGGASVSQSVTGGCTNSGPGADRQWLAPWDPVPGVADPANAYKGPFPMIYMEYNNVASGGHWVKSNSSLDPQPGGPGLNYFDATNGDTLPCNPNQSISFYAPFGADGYPSIDQVTGQVFQAEYDNANTTSSGTTSIRLNIGTPGADGNLTFLDAPSLPNQTCGDPTKLITVATNVANNPNEAANFVVTSMDAARNLYAAWVGRGSQAASRQVYVSVASAASLWRQWSTPLQVSDGSSTTGDAANIFPWVKAGGAGRADVVWYGSDIQADPSTDAAQRWNVFMGQVVFPTNSSGGVNGSPGGASLVRATPHPMHYNSACLAGTTCVESKGNRNLADFFNITIDQTGAAEIVYDDTSNGLIQAGLAPGGQQVVDHAGAPQVSVLRQSSGLGLYGTAVSGPSNAPQSGIGDPAGDALYPVIGGPNNVPGFDIRSSRLRLSDDGTLNVTIQVGELTNPGSAASRIPGTTNLQYLTRWQMGDVIYYAAMETMADNKPIFYAGKATSIDLCSVSACFPHVIVYPEPQFGGTAESGSVICPSSPSPNNPCTLTIKVHAADVGGPTSTSLLEEVGAYGLAGAVPEGAENNLTAQGDVVVPLQVDGACCYNFMASVQNGGPGPCHEGDGEGDVADGHGGKAHMRFDQDACEDGNPESVSASDSSTGDNFQSDSVSALTFNDALSNLTIAGTGTHNGQPVSFTLVAVIGTAGIGAVSLTASDGYSVGGTLLDGGIQLQ